MISIVRINNFLHMATYVNSNQMFGSEKSILAFNYAKHWTVII